jgi:ABC-type transport system substrate-binding protein
MPVRYSGWLLLLGLVLTACTQPPTPVLMLEAEATQMALPTSTPHPIAPTPAILRIGAAAFNGFDPLHHTEPGDEVVQALVYEPLLAYDAAGTLQPLLTTDLPVEAPDRLSWTVSIKPGIMLHDGTPLTADRVAAGLTRILTGAESEADTPAAVIVFRALVAAVDAAGDSVTFRVRQPFAGFPGLLADPALVIRTAEGSGTGPFQHDAAARTADTLQFTAFAAYHQGMPLFSQVQVRVYDPASLMATAIIESLNQGELDLYIGLGDALVDLPAGYEQLPLTPVQYWLVFDPAVPPLDRAALRRVLVDRVGASAQHREQLAALGLPDGFDLAVAYHADELIVASLADQLAVLAVDVYGQTVSIDSLWAGDGAAGAGAVLVGWLHDWAADWQFTRMGWPEDRADAGFLVVAQDRAVVVNAAVQGVAQNGNGWPVVTHTTSLHDGE